MKIEVFISPNCSKSEMLLDSMADLVKSGKIDGYTVTNAETHPEKIEAEKLKGIPSLKIGRFVFHKELSTADEIKKLVATTLLSGSIFGLDEEAR